MPQHRYNGIVYGFDALSINFREPRLCCSSRGNRSKAILLPLLGHKPKVFMHFAMTALTSSDWLARIYERNEAEKNSEQKSFKNTA